MTLISESALVLRRQRHLEHDARLTVLLRNEGKIIVTIKGAAKPKSRLRVFQEPFTRSEMQIFLPPQGLYGRLIQGTLTRTNPHLRINPAAFHAACRAVETIEVLLPYRAPSPEAFDILDHTLQALEGTANANVEWILFALRLLKALGHGDQSKEVLKWLRPEDPAAMERAGMALEAELERVLPRKLKSSTLSLEHA
jgi:DNA repair protein RecO